ncbi:hypothetical protein Celaphus_00000014 [Cervus elaphus hippelaphus]|uniref:Uncharacterized protein n=1 Tax=Cervus elaphus hippelaphus TaxID=46360 RepID=A0A212DA04_CEREH|nr:hypothetical protein Celaphus_00000014 [Cervus elaphus hippelaphus]
MTRRVRDGERVMPGDTGRSVRTDLEGCSLLRPGAPPSDSAAGLGPPPPLALAPLPRERRGGGG